jgi:hypothetical protein
MKPVRIDPSLDHRIRQVDPLDREGLDKEFGDDTAAPVAAARSVFRKIFIVIDGDVDLLVDHSGHLESEKTEKRTCWAPANYSNLRSVFQGMLSSATPLAHNNPFELEERVLKIPLSTSIVKECAFCPSLMGHQCWRNQILVSSLLEQKHCYIVLWRSKRS